MKFTVHHGPRSSLVEYTFDGSDIQPIPVATFHRTSFSSSGLQAHQERALEYAADSNKRLATNPGERPRPRIVCLCGSTRFWREFQRTSLAETMAGRIVLSIGAASGTDDEHFGNLPREEYDRVKAMLDELHLRKIDLADEVLVLNVSGYVGESTRREIRYAFQLGKPIRWLETEHADAGFSAAIGEGKGDKA